jgi:RES domain-containing protein
MAEVAVHFSLVTLPSNYMMVTIHIPEDISVPKLNTTGLPTDWNTSPHPSTTQAIGDQFIADNKYCVLQIPSAVTQGDYNLLINPKHPDFKRIKIIATGNFPFDKRIFK